MTERKVEIHRREECDLVRRVQPVAVDLDVVHARRWRRDLRNASHVEDWLDRTVPVARYKSLDLAFDDVEREVEVAALLEEYRTGLPLSNPDVGRQRL